MAARQNLQLPPCRRRTSPDLGGTKMLSKRSFKQMKAFELRARFVVRNFRVLSTQLYELLKE